MSIRAIKYAGGGGEKERMVVEEAGGRPEGRVEGGREAMVNAGLLFKRREDLGPEGWPGNVNSMARVLHVEAGMTTAGVGGGEEGGEEEWERETR